MVIAGDWGWTFEGGVQDFFMSWRIDYFLAMYFVMHSTLGAGESRTE